MGKFSLSTPIEFSDSNGNILPSGEYYYGPWDSKEEAWEALTGNEVSADWITRGLRFAVYQEGGGIKTYEFSNAMPASGYTISDAIEVTSAQVFNPTADDDTTVDYQTLTAAQLKGKSTAEVLDLLLFPEYSATTGVLPVRTISNATELKEVGTAISNCAFVTSTAESPCKFVKNTTTNGYEAFHYTFTDGAVVTTVTDNATTFQFKALTRSSSATTYTVTGPASSQLSNNKLYGSKGTISNVAPLAIGAVTKNVNATSATLTGYYVCGVNGTKVSNNNFRIKPDGTMCTNGTTYATTISQQVVSDTTTTADHTLSTAGSVSVDIPIPTGASYTTTIEATQFDAGTGAFISKPSLTTALNALVCTTNTSTFTTSSGSSYDVTSFTYDLSSISNYGKFKVTITLNKNE